MSAEAGARGRAGRSGVPRAGCAVGGAGRRREAGRPGLSLELVRRGTRRRLLVVSLTSGGPVQASFLPASKPGAWRGRRSRETLRYSVMHREASSSLRAPGPAYPCELPAVGKSKRKAVSAVLRDKGQVSGDRAIHWAAAIRNRVHILASHTTGQVTLGKRRFPRLKTDQQSPPFRVRRINQCNVWYFVFHITMIQNAGGASGWLSG